MSEAKTIVLGGKDFPVEAVPLGRLKSLLPALSGFTQAVSRSSAERPLTEEDMGLALTALAAGLGVSIAEVEKLPAQLDELVDAMAVLAEVSGLTPKGGVVLGEQTPGPPPATDWNQSTDSSPTS